MAKISQREKVLLGYSPNSMSNLNSSRRSSEVDFSDVFGGPPRRSSNYEYYNYEGGGSSFDPGDDFEGSRRSWFGLGEKPVFGEEMGTRRRYPSEDFFDDIFRGDQPLSRSQSPSRRDPFSSAPGSRVMSPSRSLPPMVEPFASPAKFSLPARLTNPDVWASTSVNQTSNSASISSLRFNQTTQNYDLLHADTRLSYRPSPLSHHVSINGKESTSNRSIDGNVIGPASIKHSKGSEAHGDGTLFHFSIYKWPSKGVPLSMSLRKKSPSRSKERNKIERCLSAKEGASNILVTETHKANISVIDSHLLDKSVLSAPSGMEDSENCKDAVVYPETAAEFQSLEDLNLQAPKSSSHHLQNIQEQVYDSASSCEKGSGADVDNNNSSRSPGSIRKFNRRPLGSFFQEEKKGRKRVSAKIGGKESLVKEKERPPPKHVLPSPIVDKSEVHSSFREAKDDQQRKEATGKVKDFVKMFNQEPSSNAVKNDVSQSQSTRWQGTSISEAAKEVRSTSTEMHDKTQAYNVNWSRTSWEASEVVDENSFLPGKQQFDMNSRGSVFDTPCAELANDPLPDAIKDSAPNIHATPENDMKSKELLQDINIQSEVDDQTEARGYEVKILQWSKGKEGNIRALLSTLQHVLWPNSGWKPVPLVDIIEANSVKRAYQKALLCLHPDKLQQKGAAPHQKFIAEKVFDTLQEAWDHFNSLGNF